MERLPNAGVGAARARRRGWVLRAPSGRVMARMPERAMTFDQVYWPFLDGEEDLSRIEELYPEHMWTGMASPPGPSISRPEELAAGARRAARQDRPRDHRAVRRQSARDGAVPLPQWTTS